MNRRIVFALMIGFGIVGCEHVTSGYDADSPGVTTTPTTIGSTATPAGEATTSPAASCNTTQTATIFIGMSNSFTEYDDPTYGAIAGYANATTSTPTQSAVIQATTSDVIQFVNLDTTTDHSAVGFPSNTSSTPSGFPAQPYSFPTAAANTEGAIISSQPWSTGRIPASASTTCESQAFEVSTPGTYYFGDLDFYNTITSLRDVIVVVRNATSAQLHSSKHPR